MKQLNKLQVFIAGIFIAAGLLVLPLTARPLPADSAAKDPDSVSTTDTSDNPNVITQGMYDALDGLNRSITTVDARLNRGLRTTVKFAGKASTGGGKLAVRGLSAGASGAGKAISVLGAVPLLAAHASGDALDSLTSAPVVSALTRPADNTPIPVIEPNAPVLASISVETSTAQTVAPLVSTAAWPIHGVITTEFGIPHWPYQPTHTGLDISDGKRSGITPIHTFKKGVVTEVIHSNLSLGNHIVVDHGDGVTSVYGHLYATSVKVGQIVDQNTILGYEGSTGASTGTHLHFEIRLNGQPMDPRKYISEPL